MDITFKQMMDHFRGLPTKFDAGLLQAKLVIGDSYVRGFKALFDLQRDPQGRPWRPRKRHYKHPILKKTGTLKNSISYTLLSPSTIRIFTDEKKFTEPRGSGSKSYAAFHNSPDGTYLPNIQRQFMGDSTLITERGKNILCNFVSNLI